MLLKAIKYGPVPGVVACSAGNHAQGVSITAQLLNIKCTIVVPSSAPATKLYNTRRYGAEVIIHGAVFDEANVYAKELAEERGWLYIPPYNEPDIIQGQATIAHELFS